MLDEKRSHGSLRMLRCLLILALCGACLCGPCSSGHKCGCQPESFKPTEKPAELWPGGIVFYIIDKAFTDKFIVKLKKVMKDLEEKVGQRHIQFVEAISPSGSVCRKNFVNIKRVRDAWKCESKLGMQLNGATDFAFNEDWCTLEKQILFTWLTAIGLSRENNRPNRDRFVKLHPQNIGTYMCEAFRYLPEDNLAGMEYDPDSFFHRHSCDGSCNSEYVITKLDGSPITEKDNLSPKDIEKLRHLYPSGQKVQFTENRHCLDKRSEPEVIFTNKAPGGPKPLGYRVTNLDDEASSSNQPRPKTILVSTCLTLMLCAGDHVFYN